MLSRTKGRKQVDCVTVGPLINENGKIYTALYINFCYVPLLNGHIIVFEPSSIIMNFRYICNVKLSAVRIYAM